MQYIVSPTVMRDSERAFINSSGISGDTLMERAAWHILSCILQLLSDPPQPPSPDISLTSRNNWPSYSTDDSIDSTLSGTTAAFAAGPGNNGGDAWAAARLYCSLGGQAHVISLCDPASLTGDALLNYERARAVPGLTVRSLSDLEAMPTPAIWIDGLFGTGLNRPLSGAALSIVQHIARDRASHPNCKLLAVDIPSGLNGETGINGGAIPSDMTVTFQFAKLGHFLADGQDLCGELRVVDIGIDPAYLPKHAPCLASLDDIALTPRLHNSHKGNYGQLLLVAGSIGFAGAAIMCASAAARAGVGLLTVACPRSIWQVLQIAIPSAMVLPLPDDDAGCISAAAAPIIAGALANRTAFAIGPGITRNASPRVLEVLLSSGLPGVIDADGLNVLAGSRELIGLLRPCHVLTPHPGELARLLGRSASCSVEDARALADLGSVGLVKGPCTIVAEPGGGDMRLCAAGTPGLARGGSGDVLTGIIAALLARDGDAFVSAWQAAILHGEAARVAEKRFCRTSMLASDLPDAIADVFNELEQRTCRL